MTNKEANKEYPVNEAVQPQDRHIGFVDMVLTWMGANCQPGSWAIGGTLAGVGFLGAFGIIFLANPLAYAILALVGYISFRVGTSTMGLTRVIFGIRGSKIPTVASGLNTIGWAAVNNFFAAITMSYILAGIFGTPAYGQPGSAIILVIGSAVNGLVSLFFVIVAGGRSVKIAERIMMIILIVFTTWVTIVVFQQTSLTSIMAWRPNPENAVSFGRGVDAMLAFSISWACVIGEFTRYTKTKYSATIAPMVGANLAVYWFALVGAIGVISVAVKTGVFDPNYSDPSSIAIGLGLGWVALIVVALSTMTTNLVAYYVLAYNIMNLDVRLKFKKAAWIGGLAAVALSWIPIITGDFIGSFFAFVNILGAIFPPLLAVIIVDYYLIRKGKYVIGQLDNRQGPYWYKAGFNWFTLGSWLVGVAVFYLIRNSGFGVNSVGAVMPGFLAAGIIYFIAAQIAIKSNKKSAFIGIGDTMKEFD